MNKNKTKSAINAIAKMVYASALVLMFEQGDHVFTGAILYALTVPVLLFTTQIEEGLDWLADALEYLGVFFNDLYLGFWATGLVELALGKYITAGMIAIMVLAVYAVKRFFPRKQDFAS